MRKQEASFDTPNSHQETTQMPMLVTLPKLSTSFYLRTRKVWKKVAIFFGKERGLDFKNPITESEWRVNVMNITKPGPQGRFFPVDINNFIGWEEEEGGREGGGERD